MQPAAVTARYPGLTPGMAAESLLPAVCACRSFFLPGREPDIERAAHVVLDEFRAGRIGRITLETPEGESHAETT